MPNQSLIQSLLADGNQKACVIGWKLRIHVGYLQQNLSQSET